MKFENLNYYKLFSSTEGKNILTSILQNGDLVKLHNHDFWRSKFRVDPAVTPTNSVGEASVIVKMREAVQGELMSMRAPLSHSAPLDAPAVESYTAPIPSFSPRQFHENGAERYEKMQLLDLGEKADEDFIFDYAANVLQFFVDSGNQTLSHASAQLLSTGKINVNWGVGSKGLVVDCKVPSANRLTAGTAAWTDTSFTLLDHLRSLVETVNGKHGEMVWQLEISRDKFINTFLKNTQVLNWIKLQYSIANSVLLANVPDAVATVDYAVAALAADPTLPRITIIQEKQNDIIQGTVSGWVAKYAVLRPIGYAGYIVHSTPIERKVYPTLGAKSITKNFSTVLDGLGLIIAGEQDNGELREWKSQFIMNAIPTLDEFLYHYIIDTTTADN